MNAFSRKQATGTLWIYPDGKFLIFYTEQRRAFSSRHSTSQKGLCCRHWTTPGGCIPLDFIQFCNSSMLLCLLRISFSSIGACFSTVLAKDLYEGGYNKPFLWVSVGRLALLFDHDMHIELPIWTRAHLLYILYHFWFDDGTETRKLRQSRSA